MPLSDSPLRDKPFFMQALALIAMIFAAMLLAALLSFIVQAAVLGVDGAWEFSESFEQRIEHIQLAKALQILVQITAFAIPAFLFAYLLSGKPAAYLNLLKPPSFIQVLLAVLIVFSAGMFSQLLADLNDSIAFPAGFSDLENSLNELQEKNDRLTDAFLDVDTLPGFLVLVVMMGIVPALSEEFLFRGVMQRMLTEGRKFVFYPILVTALTFSIIHFQFYNFLAITFMGLVLGYLYHWSQNLWVPIIGHMAFNSFQVLLVYLHRIGKIETNIEEVEQFPVWLGLAGGLFLFNFFILFRRASVTKS